jgi:chemotaxis methyl-accepting protein methylase
MDKNTLSYKVNNKIFKYLMKTYNNKQKSQWETKVQDASSKYLPESFDIISIHNVLPYIKDRDGQKGVDLTLENLYRSLKPGGVMIADPYFMNYSVSSIIFNKMEEIHDGIYKKI